MPYYMLTRLPSGELYAMGLTLSEDEARRYGHEGELVSVTTLVVWTDADKLEQFREILLSVEQENLHYSPFAELIRDMQAEKVDVVERNSVGMSGTLQRERGYTEFVLLNPGPEQEVLKVGELLAQMGVDPADRQGIVEPDKEPKIIGAPKPALKAERLNQAVGKT